MPFRRPTASTIDSKAAELSLDLTRARYVASHHLGIIAEAWSTALASERELVVKDKVLQRCSLNKVRQEMLQQDRQWQLLKLELILL